LKDILCQAGLKTGIIGTNGIEYGDTKLKTINTTPESHLIQKTLRDMLDDGVEVVVMEVSSQGLMTHRVDNIMFDIGIFTNISPDHIGPGEHASFEEYFNYKKRLFQKSRHGIVNADDAMAQDIIRDAACPVTTYGITNPADLMATNISNWRTFSALGVKFTYFPSSGKELDVQMRLPGKHNAYNALAVLAVCEKMGLDVAKAAANLKNFTVKGRAQVVPFRPGVTVVIDYAHNQLSMESILATLRGYDPKRLVCLFGSVGDRTKFRRKQLGQTASRLADYCIVTSDNPDFENPTQIINDILTGFTSPNCPYVAIADRKEAIEYALANAEEGDIILLAGKGHEEHQLIEGIQEPFSEQTIIETFVYDKEESLERSLNA
ncbi:MAG: UDP-N-acetylmuramoyl-L-alanyl-D-glutamate--2,6-diaminopimelate ligase, partial [Peptococcaceae bacterium]|nr:UDP-N-acetylmuramoyl-L-alanyl-D-glutamate--2,6-diaminopimelate ligase [Peptococcaceae bacterium]